MLVNIEAHATPPDEKGVCRVLTYAYASVEADEAHRTDSVKDANQARDIVKCLEGGDLICEPPPKDKGLTRLWVVQMRISNTHNGHSAYTLAYQKFGSVPLHLVRNMMDTYHYVKAVVKRSHKELEAAKAERRAARAKGGAV